VPAASVVTFAGVQRVYTVAEGKAVEHRVRLGVRVGAAGAEAVELIGGAPVRVRG